MFNELNINHISLLKGAVNTENRNSEAASFLVEIVNKSPNTITILATGSLTNLLGAYNLDNNFFDKVKEIVLMGRIAKLLIINSKNPNSNINMPTLIKDVDKFNNIIFELWSNI
jgi:purine nucleosidase